jgi:hypothetical protein
MKKYGWRRLLKSDIHSYNILDAFLCVWNLKPILCDAHIKFTQNFFVLFKALPTERLKSVNKDIPIKSDLCSVISYKKLHCSRRLNWAIEFTLCGVQTAEVLNREFVVNFQTEILIVQIIWVFLRTLGLF